MAKNKLHHPAAFINVISEEGTKEEAVAHLQKTWNELLNVQIALIGLGFTTAQFNKMKNEAKLGKVF